MLESGSLKLKLLVGLGYVAVVLLLLTPPIRLFPGPPVPLGLVTGGGSDFPSVNENLFVELAILGGVVCHWFTFNARPRFKWLAFPVFVAVLMLPMTLPVAAFWFRNTFAAPAQWAAFAEYGFVFYQSLIGPVFGVSLLVSFGWSIGWLYHWSTSPLASPNRSVKLEAVKGKNAIATQSS